MTVKWQKTAPKLPAFSFHGTEFYFRPVIRKEFFTISDKLLAEISAGPSFIPSWALNDCKLSIGFHLQFTIHNCLNTNTFPDFWKNEYITHVNKKGDRPNPEFLNNFGLSVRFCNTSSGSNQFVFQKKSDLDTIIVLTEKNQ